MDQGRSTLPVTVIGSSSGRRGLGLAELLRSRELAYFLIWRDLKVRYRQTIFGALWAVIQPLGLLAVFSLTIGRLGGISPSGTPYPLFAFAALVPWTLFSQGLLASSNSLINASGILQKVYFPRLLLPIAAVGAVLLDFAVSLVVLLVVAAMAGFGPGLGWFWLIPLTLLMLVVIVAVGTWLSAVNVRFRDVRVVVPFLVQLWLFASPVAYSPDLVPQHWRFLYELNPVVGVVEGFRWALLGTGEPPVSAIVSSLMVALVVLIGGLEYFRRVERTFADVI